MKQQAIAQAAQIKAGYGVAVTVGSTPLWINTLTDICQLIAVVIAIAVGATTFYMNMKRIQHYRKKK